MIDPQHAQIAEWLKITVTALIGTVVGFASAIASDLLKTKISDRRKRRKMQVALYSELMMVYSTVRMVLNAAPTNERQRDNLMPFITSLRFDAYEFAKKQPDVFYDLMEAHPIDDLYGRLLMITPKFTTDEAFVQCYDFMYDLYRLTRGEILDHTLLRTCFSSWAYDEICKNAEFHYPQIKPFAEAPKADKELKS